VKQWQRKIAMQRVTVKRKDLLKRERRVPRKMGERIKRKGQIRGKKERRKSQLKTKTVERRVQGDQEREGEGNNQKD